MPGIPPAAARVLDMERRMGRLEKYWGEADRPPPPDEGTSLLDTYRLCYPGHLPPDHLEGAVEALEEAERGPAFRVLTYPRRAGKTDLVLAGIVHRLRVDPSVQVIYATNAQDAANKRSGKVRKMARRLGVPMDESSQAKKSWMTGVGGGGLWAASIGSTVVGEGADLLVLDDLFKGRAFAESALRRDQVWDWLMADILPTLSPRGSVIVSNTRWHEDDVSGRVISRLGWDEVLVPALYPDGSSFWPDRWSEESLLKIRERLGGKEGYDWCSIYQGSPRPAGKAVFKGERRLAEGEELPWLLRVWVGLDPGGYSGKRSADPSAAVVLGEDPATGLLYVLDVRTSVGSQEEWAREVRELVDEWSPEGVVAYVNRTEQNYRALMREVGVHVSLEWTVHDKTVHARPCSYAWNAGRVVLPRSAPWLDALLRQLRRFPSGHDDCVDALSAAFNRLAGSTLDFSQVDPGDGLPLAPRLGADWSVFS